MWNKKKKENMENTPILDYLEFLGLFISCELMQEDLIFLFGYEGLII